MAIQGFLNSILGQSIGEIEATFIVHAIATSLLGIFLLTGITQGGLSNITFAPWFGFLGGPLSVIIVWGVLSSIANVGAAAATTAILTIQILTALLIDYFGFTGKEINLDKFKIIGVLLFITGTYLLLKESS